MMFQMSRSRWLPSLIVLAFLASFAAAGLPASADPQSQLQENEQKQEELDAKIDELLAQKGALVDKISVIDEERAVVEKELAKVDADLDELNDRIAVVQERLTRTQIRLGTLSQELNQVLRKLIDRTDVFTARAVEIYKAGPAAYLESMLASEDLSELLDRYQYYESSLESDNALIEEIAVLRDVTDQKRTQVEERKLLIAADKAQLEKDRAKVAAIRDRKASSLADLNKLLSVKQTIVAEIDSKKRSYEAAQARIDADSDRIEAMLAANTTGGPGPGGSGQLAWPCSGSVSSGYGYRTHPIFGDRRLHAGIDLSCPYGAAVYAADGGTVSFVGVMGGYGNVVVVDHGGGLATTYNHLSSFQVSTGDKVSRSEHIASVGSTGYSTGAHLHFEVRVNGTPVDPMPYLQ